MAVKQKSAFAAKLARENGKVKEDRAVRISDGIAAEQQMLIYKLESEVRKLEDKLDEMTDVSTDNVSTTLNVISKSFNPSEFVQTMHNTKVNLILKNQELTIAREVMAEWFTSK